MSIVGFGGILLSMALEMVNEFAKGVLAQLSDRGVEMALVAIVAYSLLKFLIVLK